MTATSPPPNSSDRAIARLQDMAEQRETYAQARQRPLTPTEDKVFEAGFIIAMIRAEAAAEQDAKRWRAFLSTVRFRLFGWANIAYDKETRRATARERSDNWMHMGMEIWDTYPIDPKIHGPDAITKMRDDSQFARSLLTVYADTIAADQDAQPPEGYDVSSHS